MNGPPSTGLRSPWFWLWLQAFLICGLLVYSSLSGVLRGFDAKTYEDTLAPTSVSGKLQSMRTLGYPLFLAAVARVHAGPSAVAIAQVVLFVASVLAFARGFQRFSGSSWLALAAATPLLYCPLVVVYSAAILADVLAAAWSLTALAGLWWVLARPSSRTGWAVLTSFLFLAYQTRPSYLFLLVLVPLAGGAIVARRVGCRAVLRRPMVALLLASWLPFLAWSSLRGLTTGHFGLVSFGGVNLVGLTASMLSPEVVAALPAEHRELGRRILDGRAERGLKTDGRMRFQRWGHEYNRNVWKLATRKALRLCRKEGQTETEAWVEANRCLTALSWAVIRLRPTVYGQWLASALGHSLVEIGRDRTVWGTGLLLVLAVIARGFLRLQRESAPSPPGVPIAGLDLTIVAALFLAGSLGLMALVEAPIDRYLYAAMLLVPSAFATLALELVLATRSEGKG